MSDPKTERGGNIVPTILTALSALGIAYLTYVSTTTKSDTDALLRDREINLEQTKFDASERERYERNLLTIIAGVLDNSQQKRLIGIATVRMLYPDQAEEVLKTIAGTDRGHR